MASFVGGQGQQDDGFIFKFEKWQNGIAAHVWRYGDRVKVERFKKSPGVQPGSIANIAAFCIRDFEMRIRDIFEGFAKTLPPFRTKRFIKGYVRFVSNTKVMRRVDDALVEFKNGIIKIKKMFWNKIQVGIQSDTEK